MPAAVRLAEREPRVAPARIVAELAPPPRFAAVRFETYLPDPAQPSQAAAVAGLRAFAGRLAEPTTGRRKPWFRRGAAPPEGRAGVYLDGGFGVGKTHLLASLWHVAPGPTAFGTFVNDGSLKLEDTTGFLGGNSRLAVSGTWSAMRAMPKSVIFTRPSGVMSRLPGLISRCTRPAWWAACSAEAVCATMSST